MPRRLWMRGSRHAEERRGDCWFDLLGNRPENWSASQADELDDTAELGA